MSGEDELEAARLEAEQAANDLLEQQKKKIQAARKRARYSEAISMASSLFGRPELFDTGGMLIAGVGEGTGPDNLVSQETKERVAAENEEDDDEESEENDDEEYDEEDLAAAQEADAQEIERVRLEEDARERQRLVSAIGGKDAYAALDSKALFGVGRALKESLQEIRSELGEEVFRNLSVRQSGIPQETMASYLKERFEVLCDDKEIISPRSLKNAIIGSASPMERAILLSLLLSIVEIRELDPEAPQHGFGRTSLLIFFG